MEVDSVFDTWQQKGDQSGKPHHRQGDIVQVSEVTPAQADQGLSKSPREKPAK